MRETRIFQRLIHCLWLLFALFPIASIGRAQPPEGLPKLEYRKWSGSINVPDPVAVSVDYQGRVYATQTKRRKIQDLDIRQHRSWIPDDVGLQSVEDKRDFFHRVLAVDGNQQQQSQWVKDVNGDGQHDWRDLTVISEVIYQLRDEDGDGTADTKTIFAEDFRTEVTGIAAGVLAYGQHVYATVAPDLWKLTDTDGDGRADRKASIAHGFGLHIAYAGHDMHGPIVGPDGKIYWSIGDKGIHVTTPNGKTFAYPNQGGVLRCNLDGSDFEVYAHGLRNVQEFDFDQYGNMFGVDNDSDQPTEKERFVYIVDGMDAGWRCNYQYRGAQYNPWMDESLWDLPGEHHAAYIIPPISHYVDGPAGFKFNPGTALSESYENYFFMTSAPNGYQHAFQVERQGDSFKMVRDHLIGSGMAIVGLAFGPDGGLYGADWDGGYPLDEKGSVVRIDVPTDKRHPLRDEVRDLLETGFTSLTKEKLVGLLGHADRRVRLESQFELVRRGDAYSLAGVARDATAEVVSRLHGIWGLGQLGRDGDTFARDTLGLLFTDKEVYVRGQAAKTYGELRQTYGTPLVKLLSDEDPYVRTLAGLALARQPTKDAVSALFSQADQLAPEQHYLRHSLVMGLSACADSTTLAEQKSSESEMRRLCCVLALRKQRSTRVEDFLLDASTWVATEAARAIHDDQSIAESLTALAAVIEQRDQLPAALLVRSVNANYRLGDRKSADRLMQLAANTARPIEQRMAALEALQQWREPPLLDRVDGRRRELDVAKRDVDLAAADELITQLLSEADPKLRKIALQIADHLQLDVSLDGLRQLVTDPAADEGLRAEALTRLVAQTQALVQLSLDSGQTELQQQAMRLLGSGDSSTVIATIRDTLDGDASTKVKQTAIGRLVRLQTESANRVLLEYARKARVAEVDPGLVLDLYNALARSSQSSETKAVLEELRKMGATRVKEEKLALYAFARDGGDVDRGKQLFRTHVEAQCSRCHKVGPRGSEIGPELTNIASKRDADYLLRAIIKPSADIEDKYRTSLLLLASGEVVKGVIQERNDQQIILADSKGELVEIDATEVEEISTQNVSLMPEISAILSPSEVRDLVAYLRSL